MTEYTLNLPDEISAQLLRLAQECGRSPEELLQESIEKWLDADDSDFLEAATHVLKKNTELYQRLA
jgi:antitoxin FitA